MSSGNPMLPVEPFAQWLEKRAAYYALFSDPNGDQKGYSELARRTGLNERSIRRYINREYATVSLCKVDEVLLQEGNTMLFELYDY